MKHFYQEIEGYFTFPSFYSWLASQAYHSEAWWPERGPFRMVEVGVYTGQSVAYLGVELINRDTDATIDLVDISLIKAKENLRLLEGKGVIRGWHEMRSVDASKLYDNDSLDAVFIDADHSYSTVRDDIEAWLPKIRKDGIMAGHDYCHWPQQNFGVMQAVNERFERFEIWPGSKGMGDEQMKPHYWPVWCVRV